MMGILTRRTHDVTLERFDAPTHNAIARGIQVYQQAA
jgi:hypothetical protein